MKLPKDFPIKLTYVLLIILIWNYMISPSQKEQFDMKTLNDIKIKLTNKKTKEEFDIETMNDITALLTDKIKMIKSHMLNDDKKETFKSYNYNFVDSLKGAPI